VDFLIVVWNWLVVYYETNGPMFFYSQVALTFVSVWAHMLMQSLEFKDRKLGTAIGLLGQPAWFAFAISTQAWFFLFVCFLYLYSWGKGFYNHWVKINPNEKRLDMNTLIDQYSIPWGCVDDSFVYRTINKDGEIYYHTHLPTPSKKRGVFERHHHNHRVQWAGRLPPEYRKGGRYVEKWWTHIQTR
jgi:hypothetical protein